MDDDIKWELMPGQIRVGRSAVEPSSGAKALRAFRLSMNLSGCDFGRPLLMDASRISDFERGITRITPLTALKIEKRYGISAKLLLEE